MKPEQFRQDLIHGLTKTRITHPVLKRSVDQAINGERPFFNEWMGMLESSIQGVNSLVDQFNMDPFSGEGKSSAFVGVDRDLVAIQSLPRILPSSGGKLPSIECKNQEETDQWLNTLPETFDTLTREIRRGHYKNPRKIIQKRRDISNLSTVFGYYVYDGYARAAIISADGAVDIHENLHKPHKKPEEKPIKLRKPEINKLLKTERDSADLIVNALCEEAVVAAERAIATGEPSDKIGLVGFFDQLDWYKLEYGFTPQLVARAKAVAATVNPNESAQIFRGLLS